MSTEKNKAIVRAWFEEVLNHKRPDRADDHVAQDYVDHGALSGQAPGLGGAKRSDAPTRCDALSRARETLSLLRHQCLDRS